MTAVYSGELGPLNLQLCRVTKVRNSNLRIFQTVQIVLESQNRGNIGSVSLLRVKACNGWLCSPKGSKRGERISPSLCSHDTSHDILDMLILLKLKQDKRYLCPIKSCEYMLRKVIYLISNSCFLTVTPKFPPPLSLSVSPPHESKMQTEQGEAG